MLFLSCFFFSFSTTTTKNNYYCLFFFRKMKNENKKQITIKCIGLKKMNQTKRNLLKVIHKVYFGWFISFSKQEKNAIVKKKYKKRT